MAKYAGDLPVSWEPCLAINDALAICRAPLLILSRSHGATGQGSSTAMTISSCQGPTTLWNSSSAVIAGTNVALPAARWHLPRWFNAVKSASLPPPQPEAVASQQETLSRATIVPGLRCERNSTPGGPSKNNALDFVAILKHSLPNLNDNSSSQLCHPRKKLSEILGVTLPPQDNGSES